MSTLTSLRSFTVTLRCQNLSTFHFQTNFWMKHYFLPHWCCNICIKKKVATINAIFHNIDPVRIVHVFSLYSVQNENNWYENMPKSMQKTLSCNFLTEAGPIIFSMTMRVYCSVIWRHNGFLRPLLLKKLLKLRPSWPKKLIKNAKSHLEHSQNKPFWFFIGIYF